jgi:hypothetical protein
MKFPGWRAESLLSWAKVRLNEEKLSPASRTFRWRAEYLHGNGEISFYEQKICSPEAMRASKAKKTPQRENYLIR